MFKSDLEIINLILEIFRYVDSAYITGYLVLSYIVKLISTVGYFLATFCNLINCMSSVNWGHLGHFDPTPTNTVSPTNPMGSSGTL